MTKIAIFGAGAIGCYVGGRLAASGNDIIFIGRKRLGDEIGNAGLTLSNLRDERSHIEAGNVRWKTGPNDLSDAEIILVCVKSGGTEEAARHIAQYAPEGAVVVSLQNGVSNDKILRTHCGERHVLGGMVAFNVVSPAAGHFHQSTDGKVIIEAGVRSADLVAKLRDTGIDAGQTNDIEGVKWGKLLLNLNNGLNVLSGLPLVDQLLDQDYRLVLSAAMAETLNVLRSARIEPAVIAAANPSLIVRVLKLPTWIFRILAAQMLAMDKTARSSMWDDLQHDRKSEVDELNGAVVALGKDVGVATPVNSVIVSEVKSAFAARKSPAYSGHQLRALVGI